MSKGDIRLVFSVVVCIIIVISVFFGYIFYDAGYRSGVRYMKEEAVKKNCAEWYFNGQNTEFKWKSRNIKNVDTSIMEVV